MEYWIWLSQLKGIGPITQKRLLQHFKTPDCIYESSEEELLSIAGIGPILAQSIREARSLDGAFSILEELDNGGIKILIYDDPLYPGITKEMADAPIVLYYKGTLQENSAGVGIVGSRRCTGYGKQIAIEAAQYLAQHDIPVISGLAKGIDGYAHTACLKAGGYTIAFLGNGLDINYPKEHADLQAGIEENGAVISEFLPKIKARPEHFPRRNALISSWSQKLLVVEASAKSGALITAELSKSLGREVLVPPHEIYSLNGKGTNGLIRKGAIPYLEPAQLLFNDYSAGSDSGFDFLDHLGIIKKNENSSIDTLNRNQTAVEKQIQTILMDSDKTIQEIGNLTGINQVKLMEHLSIMELEGLIESSAGGRFGLK
ncbi:DNA-processing protein DprA [Acetobacterium sp.]|uniref:DNA-processing protein DprA n=1 Tax=Acetobacterium sp. TaxID=1872094 RepID=UPI002F401E23